MDSMSRRERAAAVVADRLGLQFPPNRAVDFERALKRGARACGFTNADSFVDWLADLPHDSPVLAQFAGVFTVGESYFFRDAACFDALEHTLLPALIARRRAEGTRWLRLWSAGCATGEEAYSLAIVLHRLLPDLAEWSVTILASDIDAEALDRARGGMYRRWSLRTTPDEAARRYFHAHRNGSLELAETIRRMVTFQVLNLAGPAYPALETNTVAMDLVVCRNVLMYLTPAVQRDAIARLAAAVVPGGWLVVAPAECPTEAMPGFRLATVGEAAFFERQSGTEELAEAPSIHERPTAAPADDPAVRRLTTVAALPRPRPQAVSLDRSAPLSGAVRSSGDAARLEQARSLADSGRLDEALALCELCVEDDPLDPHAHFLLASICDERGETRRAIAALRQCLYLAPQSAAAHFLLAGLLRRQAHHVEARRALDGAARLLEELSSEQVVEDAGGLTAGRLLELARAQAAAIDVHGNRSARTGRRR